MLFTMHTDDKSVILHIFHRPSVNSLSVQDTEMRNVDLL